MKRILISLFAVSALISCVDNSSKEPQKFTVQGFALGTTYSVAYIDTKESVSKSDIDSLLGEFEYSCSIYNPESRLSMLNSNMTDRLDRHITKCLVIADSLSRISDGYYDVTIKPLTSALGFGAEERESVDVDSLLEFIGYEKIAIENGVLKKSHPNIQIDLNSIAKGYSVDLLASFVEQRGVENYIVEIGGEIYSSGSGLDRDWRVGIDKPYDGNFTPGATLQAIISIKNRGLATSGNYRRFYTDEAGNRVNHTLNPKIGQSQENSMMSATVLAENCTYADGLATTMMVLGVEGAKQLLNNYPQVDAYLIYRDADSLKSYVTDGLRQLLIEVNE